MSKQRMLSSDEYDFLLKHTEFSSDQILEWYDEFLVSQSSYQSRHTHDSYTRIATMHV